MEAKMHNDEMYEHRKEGGVEAGLGEQDEKLMRKVVLKMDVRYVCNLAVLGVDVTDIRQHPSGSCTFVLVLVH
jgi:hypothetical protein